MRLGLSSCEPVGFDGGPVGFCSEFADEVEVLCCATSESVAIFGAGATGFSADVFSAATDSAVAGESKESNASKAVTFFVKRGGGSLSLDTARAGGTGTSIALAQITTRRTSLNFCSCIYPRGDLKRPFPRTRADISASHQHIVVPSEAGDGFELIPAKSMPLK